MPYQRLQRLRPLAINPPPGPGPAWYRALGGTTSQPTQPRVYNRVLLPVGRAPGYLGSLGDTPEPKTTLDQPTIDPTAQWQAEVIGQLRAGVQTMKDAEMQKWIQIGVTAAIPVFGVLWGMIGKALAKGGGSTP